MKIDVNKLDKLKRLISDHTTIEEGVTQTPLNNFMLFRSSNGQPRKHEVYQAYLLILAQGEKQLHIGGEKYNFKAGDFLAVFMPMLLEAERVDVPKDEPYLMCCIEIDLIKIANILLKLDAHNPSSISNELAEASSYYLGPMGYNLLDPVIRLLETLKNPRDTAILGESIIDEIYYRLLTDDKVGLGSLRRHLEQHGQIQEIARSVNHIQGNLKENVSVEQLAKLSNMSVSGFHRTFKTVMHTTPIQYAKTLKLHRSKALIKEGQTANEASMSVGYNSAAQFSREYKRFFGTTPLETKLSVNV
ncbi:MAG: AraC family transcriptional regulator [Spirochaetaceae bacterium]